MHRNELRLRQRLARAKGGHKRTMQRRLDAMMAGIQSKYTTLGNPVSHNIWLDVESGGSNPSVAGDDLEVDILGCQNFGIDGVFFNPQKTPHNENVTYEISSLKQLMEIF